MPDFATFHRSPNRNELYESERGKPPFYDAGFHGYVVLDPAQVHELLVRPEIDVIESDVGDVADRFHLDLSDITLLASHMPLQQSGEAHATTRRRLSEYLASRRPALKQWIAERIEGYLRPFFAAGRFEAVEECLVPMFVEFAEVLAGQKLPEGTRLEWVSMLFDVQIGIGKREKVFAQLRGLRDLLAERTGADPDDPDLLVPLTSMVFGREPLVDTFGQSLHRLISENPDRRLDELDYPPMPMATGVPYVARAATRAFEFQGIAVEPGTRFKLYVQSFEALGDPRQFSRLFGAGAHVCPGRPLSLDIWKRVTELLKTSAYRARVVRYEVNEVNFLFTGPRVLELETML